MAFAADYDVLFDRLDEELRCSPVPTAGLFAKIIGSGCRRIPVFNKSVPARCGSPIDHLIEAKAWTDCALAIVGLELPEWQVRRLVYEGGEWLCSLSRQPNVPIELDDTADSTHETPALAILRAFVDARGRSRTPRPKRSAVAHVPSPAVAMCCDNFA